MNNPVCSKCDLIMVKYGYETLIYPYPHQYKIIYHCMLCDKNKYLPVEANSPELLGIINHDQLKFEFCEFNNIIIPGLENYTTNKMQELIKKRMESIKKEE